MKERAGCTAWWIPSCQCQHRVSVFNVLFIEFVKEKNNSILLTLCLESVSLEPSRRWSRSEALSSSGRLGTVSEFRAAEIPGILPQKGVIQMHLGQKYARIKSSSNTIMFCHILIFLLLQCTLYWHDIYCNSFFHIFPRLKSAHAVSHSVCVSCRLVAPRVHPWVWWRYPHCFPQLLQRVL